MELVVGLKPNGPVHYDDEIALVAVRDGRGRAWAAVGDGDGTKLGQTARIGCRRR